MWLQERSWGLVLLLLIILLVTAYDALFELYDSVTQSLYSQHAVVVCFFVVLTGMQSRMLHMLEAACQSLARKVVCDM